MDRLKKFKEAQALKRQQQSATAAQNVDDEDEVTNIVVGHSAEALSMFQRDGGKAQDKVILTLRTDDDDEDIFAKHRRKKRLQQEGQVAEEEEEDEDVYENKDLTHLQKEEALAGVKRARYGSRMEGYEAEEKAALGGKTSTTTGLSKFDAQGRLIYTTTGGVVARLAQGAGSEETGPVEVVKLGAVETGGAERAQYAGAAEGPTTTSQPLAKKRVKGMALLGAAGGKSGVSAKAAEIAKARRVAAVEKLKLERQQAEAEQARLGGGAKLTEGGFSSVPGEVPQNAALTGHVQELVSMDSAPVELHPSTTKNEERVVEAEANFENVTQTIPEATSSEAVAASWSTAESAKKEEEGTKKETPVAPATADAEEISESDKPKQKMSMANFMMKNFGKKK